MRRHFPVFLACPTHQSPYQLFAHTSPLRIASLCRFNHQLLLTLVELGRTVFALQHQCGCLAADWQFTSNLEAASDASNSCEKLCQCSTASEARTSLYARHQCIFLQFFYSRWLSRPRFLCALCSEQPAHCINQRLHWALAASHVVLTGLRYLFKFVS